MKKAVVSGGSSGIGKAVVEAFLRAGWKVHFTYRSNEAAARELESGSGGGARAHTLEVSDREACDRFSREVLKEEGGVDVLVNNAGVTRDRPLFLMTDEDWSEVLRTNLFGLFHLTRRFAADMMKRKSGRIVNLSSVSGLHGLPGQTNYSASKAGIIGFTKALAKETGPYGVTANVVAPGGVRTPMIEKLSQEAREGLLAGVPLKRFCEPEEVARVVLFLAQDAPEYLNGGVLVLDGGAS